MQPTFILYDRRSGHYIDYAYTIKEREEKIGMIKRRGVEEVAWDHYGRDLGKHERYWFTLETTIVRNHYPEVITRWFVNGGLKRDIKC